MIELLCVILLLSDQAKTKTEILRPQKYEITATYCITTVNICILLAKFEPLFSKLCQLIKLRATYGIYVLVTWSLNS